MRQDVKDLADAMERGWKQVPVMNKSIYFETNENGDKIVSACALGHALIGFRVASFDAHPIVFTQAVIDYAYAFGLMNLWLAITRLNDEFNWSTPQIIEWLRSHQND